MKKFFKSDTFYMIGAVFGIIGGIGLIFSAVTDVPKFVYIIISVCEFTMSFSLICNCRKNK